MTIDTNILIAYLAGEEKTIKFLSTWRMQGGYFYLPTIVEAELFSFDGWTVKEEELIKLFLKENFISVPFDRELVNIAASIRKKTKIKMPDAIIAATALHTGTSLLTRNVKDFKKVKGLNLLEA